METLTNNVHDVALIFEGGGMRASYTSAVVVALLEAGIHIGYVAGISAGSSNTANYLSRESGRARRTFVEFAADPRFGDMRTFLRGEGLFAAEYIYEQTGLPGQALPFDFAAFQANPAEMRIGAFRADDGEQVWFTKDDCPRIEDLMVRVRASSSMPILMPPVTIDGRVYLDGALGPTGGIALDVAKADGFRRFLVVLTRERDYVKKPERFPGAFRRHYREFPAVADGLNDRWRGYNATREELFDLERDGSAKLFVPSTMPVSNGERSVPALARSHAKGLEQARAAIPEWKEWLGLA